MEKKKNFKIFIAVARIFIFVLLVGFVLVVCLQRFSGNRISFFNYRMFTVISGSMEPRYKIGDVLLSKDMDPSKIKVGDTISYLGARGSFKDKVITHEVVSVGKDTNGKYLFRAKGLANLIEDPIVGEDQLYGKVVYKSFILSLIYKIVSTTVGFILFIVIPLMFIIIFEFVNTLIEKARERKEKYERKLKKETEE